MQHFALNLHAVIRKERLLRLRFSSVALVMTIVRLSVIAREEQLKQSPLARNGNLPRLFMKLRFCGISPTHRANLLTLN